MKKSFLVALVLLAGAMAMSLAVPLALAEGEKNILFIFDSSGSMKDRMGGSTKIEIAKQTLSDLVTDLPEDANVGLIIYGGSVKAACNAIEVAVPVKKLNVAEIKAAIYSMKAAGKTPIAKSLEKGAEIIKTLPGSKAIILVSDGEETCGGNPPEVAAKIRAELGIDVVIHVVGFDVDVKTKQQLLAIAGGGGGKYYSAANADELKESFAKIKEEVVAPPPPPPAPEPPKPEPPKEFFTEVFDSPALSGDWTVVNADSEKMMIQDGVLTVITAPGDVAKETVKNMFLYRKEGLPENYDVILKFKLDVQGYYSNYAIWGAQPSGIILYIDKDNYMYLVSKARVGYKDKTQFWFVKCANAEVVPEVTADIPCANPGDFTIKIEKRKFKYTAFVEFQGEKGLEWKELGSFTVLGKSFYPGMLAYRMDDAKEITVEFDSFTINEVK